MIAQLFVGLHAAFEVFHHCQCVVILGFQFGDALVQVILDWMSISFPMVSCLN